MRKLIGVITLVLTSAANAASEKDVDVFGGLLLRYENEQQHINIPDRERLRAIVRLGLKGEINKNWSAQGRLSTGLKNKQNVPAITIHRFNTQPQPDNDVFVERLFVTGRFENTTIFIGKIPWKTKQLTDAFWDRNLSPVGIHVDYQLSKQHQLQFASLKPLDGDSDFVGLMHIAQWNMTYTFEQITLDISPWFVDFQGEDNAKYAKKDTQLDNQFLRLSSSLNYKGYQLGIDFGRSLKGFSQFEQYADQKNSVVVQLSQGKLKQAGDFAWHLRYLRVERFGVISEFAQNATARFATANLRGIDLRLRKKMARNWWLGARVSDMQTIKGEQEQGLRFRLEGQYTF
ncbi:hypothetical protein FX988_01097 [Paraglaciecola mesophila]|uniref:Porin n=1 Tax=Paraglaciecola mesophila TaxID=197222 RepID=A0A857JFU2_9ALTE|nr:putative porin [Paraglaciecola mesophila]QHJ10875.1 hypothetical protein FX988_01097 [Paraglaciecola mesophila]